MKKTILSLLIAAIGIHAYAKTWTVVSSGMTFSPETVTINQGDSVKFTIDGSHNAVEVSQTVWNANGNTSNNGFSIPFGGGTALPAKLTVGTHYYVCTPHAAFGMKGRIVVQAATSLSEPSLEKKFLVFQNTSTGQLEVRLKQSEISLVKIEVLDLQGRLVKTLQPNTTTDGTFFASFPLPQGWASGVYLVRIQAGTTTSFEKVLIRTSI